MNAADIMTANVITVGPDTAVQEVAQSLLANRISALPVVSETGALLGIVSEGDLLRRAEAGTEARNSRWLQALQSSETLAAEFVKSHARMVSDVMTREVITVELNTPVYEIADLLQRKHLKRVPVVLNGKVVGIVSRANLLKAVAAPHQQNKTTDQNQDSELRERVVSQLRSKPWINIASIDVSVDDGVVDLSGIVNSERQKQGIRVVVELTSGVRAVNDNLAVLLPMFGVV